ncbi:MULTISPECIES: Hpt domain-containing protein [Psychrobacter]|uniref:Hpt domain-containing protein n=1 Tax=Psychrobacter TaxID=497 RepID=UPI0008A679C2|nr:MULTISPECIES: Hpt domain-containing protein [Psychrobacter]AOY42686.1 hypothetical protein AOT82_307 [Psychrobacter sp. AntiMn-1]BBI68012.1 hypothetical protein PKHYL_22030 [Psychrobacter sp. KH172YL61]HBL95737.1 Hpt domain-containing protein [Psychrobacter sp.]
MTDMTNNNMTGQTDEEIINHEQFEDMRDLLEEDFVELIQVYLNDSQKRVAALRIAQQEDDNANGFETAHALKGASANLGTTQLVRLSSQLQECCRERHISEQADLIEEIAAALQRAEQEIYQRLGQ